MWGAALCYQASLLCPREALRRIQKPKDPSVPPHPCRNLALLTGLMAPPGGSKDKAHPRTLNTLEQERRRGSFCGPTQRGDVMT